MIKMSIWLVALPFMPHEMHHDASQCITWQSLEGILAQFSFHNHSCWDASLDNQTLWFLDPIKILDYHLKHTIAAADEHARMLWRHPSDWMRQPVVKNANQMRCAVHITLPIWSRCVIKKSSLPKLFRPTEIDTQQHILPNRFNRCFKPRSYIQNSKQKITGRDRHDVNTSLPSWTHFPKADPWLRHRDQSFAGPDPEAAFGYGNLKNFSK